MYFKHSAVTGTELLQPLDLACGTLFRCSCAIQTWVTGICGLENDGLEFGGLENDGLENDGLHQYGLTLRCLESILLTALLLL